MDVGSADKKSEIWPFCVSAGLGSCIWHGIELDEPGAGPTANELAAES
jgi:hypothetical protein